MNKLFGCEWMIQKSLKGAIYYKQNRGTRISKMHKLNECKIISLLWTSSVDSFLERFPPFVIFPCYAVCVLCLVQTDKVVHWMVSQIENLIFLAWKVVWDDGFDGGCVGVVKCHERGVFPSCVCKWLSRCQGFV